MKKSRFKIYLALNLLIMVYSFSTVCSKKAAGEGFLSFRFCLYYGIVLLLLGVYAIFWQQVIKRLPLAVAYANRAMDVVWGIVWGIVFFQERLTLGKAAGALFVIAGVILYAFSGGEEDNG